VVEELVNGFVDGREVLLEFARNGAELQRKTLDEDESPRPKKRRKVRAPKIQQSGISAEPERRSTRSQSRRDTTQASQESAKGQVIADSDEGGSQYEEEDDITIAQSATKQQPAHENPGDGLVACPGCGKRMKEEVVFTHLDHCPSSGGNKVLDGTATANGTHAVHQKSPQRSMAYIPPDSASSGKARERLPTLAYSMLNDIALRKKLQALGISSQGPKLLLQKRHTEWVNLWNANCDSREPKPKRKLLEELDIWERTQGRQILQSMNSTVGGGQGTGVMAKDFDGESWMRGNKSDFDELVRRAREKKVRAPATGDKANKPGKEPTPKDIAPQIFGDPSASTGPNAACSEAPSQVEPEAGGRTSTTKSPFLFAGSGDTERQIDTPRPLPPEHSPGPEQSQSQGSHVNGVLA
jgi:E3 ubiquitin-protein ligase RAD18